ncbi:Ferritin-3 [Spatholobus suberectus]|nr:Ferritin-3 [Spatholobus suberectus]
MLLRTASSFFLLNANGDHLLPLLNSCSSSSLPSIIRYSHGKSKSSFVPCASKGSNNRPLTGVIFEPFEEVKKELDLVPTCPARFPCSPEVHP